MGEHENGDYVRADLADRHIAGLQAQIGALSLFNKLGQKLVKRIQDASAEGDNKDDVELRLVAIIAERDALRDNRASALETAANYFDGTLAYNFVAADGYSNAFDIASELRYMSAQINNGTP